MAESRQKSLKRLVFDEHPRIEEIVLSSKQKHYIKNVLRLEPPLDVEVLFKKDGLRYFGELLDLNSEYLIKLKSEASKVEKIPVSLLIGLTKIPTLEFISEKCVEIGISHLKVFIAERSQSNRDSKSQEKIQDRIQKINDKALIQSGFELSTEFSFEKTLASALEKTEASTKVLVLVAPIEDRAGISLIKTLIQLKNIALENKTTTDDILLIVGPEGGFSPKELDLLESQAYRFCTLSKKTLRAETAAILACAMAASLYFEEV